MHPVSDPPRPLVLVVEDEPEIAALMRDFLEADGFRVLLAPDAEEATEALRLGPDCVLLDVMLPGASGFELCREIRAASELPILFLSARDGDAVASGLAALLAGGTLLIWATGRWLLTPLRHLNTQVDAIAGGDPIQRHATSPIREVENVATAVEGMAARLTQTAEQDARLEAGRRLLVSSIAHDLRTPLFSLRGYLDAIAGGLGNPRERLDQARSKADQIDRLITRLFDYARAEIDQPPQLQTTDLADAAIDATAAFELAAQARSVKLRVSACPGIPVRLDRDGFERAFANVLDNALRHTPPAGTIDVACGNDTDGAYVRVIDDGPGIAPDLLPRVFEPTVRADGACNGRAGGAGLGLAIAARLLQHQGGTIHAANTSDRGAILTLRLPRLPA